jgi:hypothetical protein
MSHPDAQRVLTRPKTRIGHPDARRDNRKVFGIHPFNQSSSPFTPYSGGTDAYPVCERALSRTVLSVIAAGSTW